MKKIISYCLIFIVLFSVTKIAIPVLATDYISVCNFAEEMYELYSEESEEGRSTEESAKCRVIVKATSKPVIYCDAECIIGNNGIYVYQYSDAETAEKAVEFYNDLPSVKWAELDGVVEGQAVSYGNHMLQSDVAMEYIVNNNLPQNEIKVAMLDTGAAFGSPNLKERVIDSGINLSESGTEGSAKADNAHGTYTSAIVVDNTPENIKIYAYKVLDEYGSGTNSALALGIDKAVVDGMDVINLSLGGDEYSQLVYYSIKAAYDAGVIVVCAAGNEHGDVSKSYPASFEFVYTVGSIDRNGNPSLYTNYGEEIDFVAPGHYVEVTPSKIQSGTSFPHRLLLLRLQPFYLLIPNMILNKSSNVLLILVCLMSICRITTDFMRLKNMTPTPTMLPITDTLSCTDTTITRLFISETVCHKLRKQFQLLKMMLLYPLYQQNPEYITTVLR